MTRVLTWLGLALVLCVGAQWGFLSALADEQEIRETPPTAAELADAAVCWQPLRARDRAWLERLAAIIVEETAALPEPLLSRADDPWLAMSVAFREASWRPNARGKRDERGLFQLMGVALAGATPDAAMEPRVNVRLGLDHMARAKRLCGPEPERFLSGYATGRCLESTRGARLALAWARAMRECGGET